jgi:hypothetical protein
LHKHFYFTYFRDLYLFCEHIWSQIFSYFKNYGNNTVSGLETKKIGDFNIDFPFHFLDISKNVQNPKPKKTFGKNSYRIPEKMI